MPIYLRDTDIAVLNALLRDGRKSFRQISKDTGFSTPTVKNRFNRLINLGVIKSISPILDLGKIVNYEHKRKRDRDADLVKTITRYKQQDRNFSSKQQREDFGIQIDKRTALNIECDYCKTPLARKIYLFRFANFERFFCCNECKLAYNKKYGGRIKSMTRD